MELLCRSNGLLVQRISQINLGIDPKLFTSGGDYSWADCKRRVGVDQGNNWLLKADSNYFRYRFGRLDSEARSV